MEKAIAYLRVSGQGQVNGYGFDRQEEAINKFAGKKFEIIKTYKEEGVSGTKDESFRPAFQEMIADALRQGIEYIIVESLDRLARELRIQENLCVYLASKDIQLYSANTGENITQAIQDDPMKKALIQIQGVFSELDKNQIVKKLRNGRNNARKDNKEKGITTLEGNGKCEGRKSFKESNPELIRECKRLGRANPATHKRLSLRKISDELFNLGYTNSKNERFTASQIKRFLEI
jgi:site-specific DNA recombinase